MIHEFMCCGKCLHRDLLRYSCLSTSKFDYMRPPGSAKSMTDVHHYPHSECQDGYEKYTFTLQKANQSQIHHLFEIPSKVFFLYGIFPPNNSCNEVCMIIFICIGMSNIRCYPICPTFHLKNVLNRPSQCRTSNSQGHSYKPIKSYLIQSVVSGTQRLSYP